MSICQSLTRSGSTPRSQRLATAWAKRCIGLPLGNFCWDAPNEARNEKGMKRREKGKKLLSGRGQGRTNMARYWVVPTQSHSTTIFHNVLLVRWPNWSIELLKPRETAASSRLAKPSACRSNSARALARLRISRNAWRVLTNLWIYASRHLTDIDIIRIDKLIRLIGNTLDNFGTRTEDNWLVCSQVASNCKEHARYCLIMCISSWSHQIFWLFLIQLFGASPPNRWTPRVGLSWTPPEQCDQDKHGRQWEQSRIDTGREGPNFTSLAVATACTFEMTEELEFRPQMVAEWDRSLSYQKYRETSSVETICWKERCCWQSSTGNRKN